MNELPAIALRASSEAPSIAALADLAVAQHADIEDAVTVLLDIVRDRPDLHDALIETGVRAAVHRARAAVRQSLQAVTEPDWTPPAAMIRTAMTRISTAKSPYEWLMPNSTKRLGDADADDLEAAAMYHLNRASGDRARAMMYRRIRKLLAPGAVVRSIPEKRLSEITARVPQ